MIEGILSDAGQKMDKTLEDLNRELSAIRTGKASIQILDKINVDYYGSATPINQLSAVNVPDPSLITIQPWDTSQISTIEKAILSSNLGLNPSNDGKLIRVPIPPLTQERREILAKQVRKISEEHRTAVRNIRRDANDSLKTLLKKKEISKDMEHHGLDEVQKITDKHIELIDQLTADKEEEIIEV